MSDVHDWTKRIRDLTERAEKAEKEIERLREKSEVLAAEWCREPAVEFAMAAIEMREMVNNPEHQQALAMALVEMQAKLDRVRELHKQGDWPGAVFCAECDRGWPCPTRHIVDGEQEDGNDQ